MKLFTIALGFLILSRPAFSRGSPYPEPAPKIPEVNLPDPGFTSIKLYTQASVKDAARLAKIKDVIAKVIVSERFKKRVLGAWYKGKAQFVMTSLSNPQVYNALRKGNELGTGNDYEWDMEIGIKSSRCSTLGWTYPNVKMFWFNSCTFYDRTDAGLGGTMCHEYSHKLGFEHSSEWRSDREYTVPYAVGNICAELYPEFI